MHALCARLVVLGRQTDPVRGEHVQLGTWSVLDHQLLTLSRAHDHQRLDGCNERRKLLVLGDVLPCTRMDACRFDARVSQALLYVPDWIRL